MTSLSSRNTKARIWILLPAWLVCLLCTSYGSDWTRWRGPEGTGISKETEWKPQALARPKILWTTDLGVGHSAVSVEGKRLYTMGNRDGSDHIYCLNAETGKEIWKHSYRCPAGNYSGTRATPVLDGDLVYTLSRQGHAFCLDAGTGKVRWQKDLVRDFGAKSLRWGLAGSPLVVGNAVLYNARANGIAIDKTTGRRIWASGAGLGGYSTPVHFKHKGKDCAAIFGEKNVFVVDVANGRKLYSYPWETQYDVNAADPVYFAGKLFITSGYNRGCALLDISGSRARKLWENKNIRAHFSTPIFLDGSLYGVDGNTGRGQLRCLDVRTGQARWTQRGQRRSGFENLMVAGGKIIAIDGEGALTVAAAVPSGFQQIARARVLPGGAKKWTAPVLANGLIYCRDGNGTLVCVDVR